MVPRVTAHFLTTGSWRACRLVREREREREFGAHAHPVGKHQCIELDVSHNQKPVQRDKRCDVGSLGFVEDLLSCCVLNHLKRFDCTCYSPAWKWQGPGREVVACLEGRAWSSQCCTVQTCMIVLLKQCGLWESAVLVNNNNTENQILQPVLIGNEAALLQNDIKLLPACFQN